MRLARKLTLAIATTALLLSCLQGACGDAGAPAGWTIEITPAARVPAAPAEPIVVTNRDGQAVEVDPAAYDRVYRSIPFRRSEYRVNPNYRHDSTMEILTGNARHQTVIEHEFEHPAPVQPTPAPARPSRILTPLSGWSYAWGFPYFLGLGW